MLVRGTNNLEIEVEEQVAIGMIAAGIVEAVTATDGIEPVEPVEPVEDIEEPESATAKSKK